MFTPPAILLIDGYKTSHMPQYPEGTEVVYSNWTPRSDKYLMGSDGEGCLAFGPQFLAMFLHDIFKKTFFDVPKAEAVGSFKRIMDAYLGKDAVPTAHIEALHDHGYLPIMIKALPEGTMCPIGVPMLTIVNEEPEFFWVTNYLESIISSKLWVSCTSATIARLYKKILMKAAQGTGAPTAFVDFQGHDFSMRGMDLSAAMSSDAGHLLSFAGTDCVPAIPWLEYYYGADVEKELVGCSVPATEHSVMCMGGKEDELETFRRLITELYKAGIISIVSDTWDFWKVVMEYLPALKAEIMARDGKVVIRPDSGDPVDIICGEPYRSVGSHFTGDFDEWKKWVAELMDDMFRSNLDAEDPHYYETSMWKYEGKLYSVTYEPDLNRHDKQYYFVDNYESTVSKCKFEETESKPEQKGLVECLWDTFGGTVNDKGFKELDEHIGAIYGDSITLERCQQIVNRLKAKGFASSNVVFGIGSYTYQYNTRDTLGFAMKATYGEVNGEGREIFKDPATDTDKTKKSAKGLLRVDKNEEGVYVLKDQCTKEEEAGGCLETIYTKGELVKTTTLAEIRERVNATIT